MSCRTANLLPCLRFWMLWTRFSLRLSLYFGALSFYFTLMSPSVPAAEKQPHSMRLLPAHFTFGMVLCRWWAVPGFLQTWCLELRFIRPENLVSQSLRDLLMLFLCANSKCVFILHWGEDWVWPHQHKAQVNGVLQWCLFFCRFLHIWSWSSVRVTIRCHTNQSPSPSIAQFGLEASSRKSPRRLN